MKFKMSFRRISLIAITASCLLPCISTFPFDFTAESDIVSRDSRQLSAITNPFRRVANSTRHVVNYIREYSTARLQNTTTPAPQTSVGRRVVPLLQHVTINNIREAVNSLLNSAAAPAVVGIIKNIDRDTLQLFNSPSRTVPPLGILPTTTPKPTPKPKPTKTKVKGVTVKVEGSNATTTVAPAEKSTKTPVAEADIRSTGGDKEKKVEENEDDEDDSTEDD